MAETKERETTGGKMSEHIKTGAELYNIGKYKPEMMIKDGVHFAISKWVSLSWLKEQIKKLRQWEEVKPEYYDAIKDVLSLLEEK
jgi:hypothetical protein